MIGALLLGLFCGIVARILVPNDAFRKMSGPRSWLVSLVLGLAGALVGYLIFTVGLGIGAILKSAAEGDGDFWDAS